MAREWPPGCFANNSERKIMMSVRYSDNYIRVCNETETVAMRILERPLTERERKAIWEAGTLTWLEMRVQVPMQQNPENLESTLAAAADELENRLEEMIRGLAGMISTLLSRELSDEEHRQLVRIPDVLAVMQIGEDVSAADPERRETLLKKLLSEL